MPWMTLTWIWIIALLAACEGPAGPEQKAEGERGGQAAQTPDEARIELTNRGISYSRASFIGQAGEGNLAVVRLFLTAGMNVNVQNDSNHTAVMVASYGGHLDVVQFLVENGADHLSVALSHAASGGHLQILLFLAEKGADLGVVHSDGATTPLTIAAHSGHLEVVRYLVGHGYDDKHRPHQNDNDHGDWALVQAARGGHLEVVRFLMNEGFEVNPVYYAGATGRGETPLMYAARGGHLEIVRFLVERGADIHMRTVAHSGFTWSMDECLLGSGARLWYGSYTFFDASRECTALILAAEQGHEDVVGFLVDHWMIEAGADDQDTFGATALMFSALIGDSNRVQTLIDNGGDFGAETSAGFTAFLLAVHNGHVGVMHLLLAVGSDVNHKTGAGSTALMYASYLGNLEVVRLLVASEAEANVQNGSGVTALMAAAYAGHLEIARLLVESGANVDVTDGWGQTALGRARANGHQAVVEYLQAL